MSTIERHTITVLTDNEPGVLARVVGLFSGRGYNIESLTVAEVDAGARLSRFTIVTSGSPMVIEQIKAQLDRLVPVHDVHDLTAEGPRIERELALVKVRNGGQERVEALRIADIFRARAVDSTIESFVFEISGATEKLNAFIGLMADLGEVEVSRTGVVAIARGAVVASPMSRGPMSGGPMSGGPMSGGPMSRGSMGGPEPAKKSSKPTR